MRASHHNHAVTITQMADIPPPPNSPPPQPSYSDIPPASQLPPAAPGYLPPGGYPSTRPGTAIASQFTGMALWSIILGALSVGVPIATGLLSGGGAFFFYILPIFGFIRGIQAVTRGQTIGGIIGIVLNILGGLISLIASGVLFR
jgi:hypothetical protein